VLAYPGCPGKKAVKTDVVVVVVAVVVSELFSAVMCTTVVHNDTHTHEQFLKMSVGLGLLRFSLCVFVLV